MNKQEEWVWYSIDCSYWTDDFGDLSETEYGFIPCCPRCGLVGYQAELDAWNEGVKEFDEKDPGYRDFINEIKKTCKGPGVTVTKLWEDHKKAQRVN